MDIVSDILRNLVVGLVGTGVLTALGFLWRKRAAVRRWQLSKPSSLKVVVSTSASVDTGEYQRPTTGAGQVKAMALLAPALARAHRTVDLQNIILSNSHRGEDLEGDLLLIGGPKTNEITRRALQDLADIFGVTQDESTITAGEMEFSGETKQGQVSEDYGIIIRARSPFNPKRRVVLLSGGHTFGTIAAARYFKEHKLPRGDFAVVVRSKIVNDHALAPEPVWGPKDAQDN